MILNKHNLDEFNKKNFFLIKNLFDEKDIKIFFNFLKTNSLYNQIPKKILTIKDVNLTL